MSTSTPTGAWSRYRSSRFYLLRISCAMIAVVSTCYNEADLLDLWIRHLLAEEVDLIMVADKLGRDCSRAILEDWHIRDERVVWLNDIEGSHRQAYWTDLLASEAHQRGADWILPADIDEFPYATEEGTIGETLSECQYDKLYMKVWPHKTQDFRFEQHRLPKVCYRWSPNAHVTMGSHDVSLPGGAFGILDMRELQYRSFEHFCNKAMDRNETLEPSARARNDGSHHLRLEKMNRQELLHEWELMQARPVAYDPAPIRVSF